MLCRVVFIAANWDLYADNMDKALFWSMFRGGLRFDTSAICYLSSLYVLMLFFPLHLKETRSYHTICKWVLIVPNFLGIVLNLIDTVYYRYSDSRTTSAFFTEFGGDDNLGRIFLKECFHSWYLVLIGLLLLLFLATTVCRPRLSDSQTNRFKLGYYLGHTVGLAVGALLVVIGIRGGASGTTRPITMQNAHQYVDRPADAIAVLNSPFCMIRTAGKSALQNPGYFSAEELDNIFTAIVTPQDSAIIEGSHIARKKNVVVLILESFGTEYFGFYNRTRDGYDGCTPFLDSLAENSMVFGRNFSNGRKSIDAAPSVLCGLPYLYEHFITSNYSLNSLRGMPAILSDEGYSTAFFHGAPNGSMGLDAIAGAAGVESYYGMTEFEDNPSYPGHKAFDGTWGIWDEEFLQFQADCMDDLHEPFMTVTFTVTSHHPFAIPERYADVYPEGQMPIQKCIRYTDHALRLFFEKISRSSWYDNTIFVLTGDHTNQTCHQGYQTDRGLYDVPVIFFDPSGEFSGMHNDMIAQQIDIMPTVLGWLGYDLPYVSFGQDLLHTDPADTYAVNYSNGIFQLFKGEYMMQYDGQVETAFYNYVTDPMLQDNLAGTMLQFEKPMLDLLKAIMQQYASRMISDELVFNE